MGRSTLAAIEEATGSVAASLKDLLTGKTRDEFASDVSNVLATVITNSENKVINALADHLVLTAALHGVSGALCGQEVCQYFFDRF